METKQLTASEAKQRLLLGNARYAAAEDLTVDTSAQVLAKAVQGQQPYAVIVTCSDSRVVPELIFSAGIGELFVIRIAGNVMDSHQLGSIEYAAAHLGTRLVVVLGHTGCGAVHAAIHHGPEGHIQFITDEIRKAIGTEQDDYRACCLNVQHSCGIIEQSLLIRRDEAEAGLQVLGAVYHLETGAVEFL